MYFCQQMTGYVYFILMIAAMQMQASTSYGKGTCILQYDVCKHLDALRRELTSVIALSIIN